MQKNKAVITGEILKNQARKLQDTLPQYEGKEKPKFSNGWLDGFKKQFKIKEYVQYSEVASTEINTPNAIAQMEKVRGLAIEYGPRDTFNMDETSLFWKLTPDRTLAGSGGKKAKDRITLALIVNGDGSDKLKAWVIGKSKNPQCFKNIN